MVNNLLGGLCKHDCLGLRFNFDVKKRHKLSPINKELLKVGLQLSFQKN